MKNIIKIVLFFIFIFGTTSVFAKDNALSSISVSEDSKGYKTVLNTDKDVTFKKSEENSNAVYFELNDISAQNNTPVYYDNVKNLESVTVQKIAKNKIRIYIKGENAANTRLFVKNKNGATLLAKEKTSPIKDDLGKDFILMSLGILLLTIFIATGKEEKAKIIAGDYNNEYILASLKQRKMIKISDFQTKENVTIPIKTATNVQSNDLEVIRKSA